MRKVFSILTLALLMISLAACSDKSDDDQQVYQIQGQLLNNSVNISTGQSEKVATSNVNITWRMLDSKISINYTVDLGNSTPVTVSVKDADINPDNTYNCYRFSAASAGNGITELAGFYRPETGCIYIEFIANGTHRVISVAQMYYPYMKYNFTNTENGSSKETTNGKMLISINPSDMSASLAIGEFYLNDNSVYIAQAVFAGLHAEATGTGYKITYSGDQRSTDGSYVLNEFEANVTGGGQVVNGTITINGNYNGTFAGKAFAN